MSVVGLPTLSGDGTRTRDVTRVDDIIRGLMRAAEAQLAGVYNFGAGETLSLSGVVVVFQFVDILDGERAVSSTQSMSMLSVVVPHFSNMELLQTSISLLNFI